MTHNSCEAFFFKYKNTQMVRYTFKNSLKMEKHKNKGIDKDAKNLFESIWMLHEKHIIAFIIPHNQGYLIKLFPKKI